MGFKSMKKMETTEPSVDEVGKGMKKGGKTKKMALGGGMRMGALQAAAPAMMAKGMPTRNPMPARRPMAGGPTEPVDMAKLKQVAAMTRGSPSPAMPARSMQPPMKKGGEVESKKTHAKEMRDIKGVKKELMAHEDKPASKGHKGLKSGGIAGYKTGGLIQKYATGGVVNGAAGYKEGGHAVMKCKDGGGFKAMKKGNC
jgi:hypothetical protein